MPNSSSADSSSFPLAIHLCGDGLSDGPGRPLRAIAGQTARLVESDGGLAVEVDLASGSRAEQRWCVSQLFRRLRGMFPLGAVTLSAEGVDDATVLTIALDLHNRTRKKLALHDLAQLEEPFAFHAKAEDGYRRWVNEDPSIRTSVRIAEDVSAWAEAREDATATVLAEPELTEHGLRLLMAVGGASKTSPPRLVVCSYHPEGSQEAPLMLLGKGITFDTGGINVKPYASYVSHMKNDMAGAALAWWLFRSLVEAGVTRPLLVVLPTCENAVGEDAMRPGSIVKSYRGKTVRIDHTDAEGRLALADGLAYAVDTWAPSEVLCFATLTTAALTAYGPYATPVHFADASLESELRASAALTGEDLHFFPYRAWHFEANRDQEAQLRNTARLPGHASRAAGSRNAAHFLKHFADTPLTHLDIFASTWNWAGDAPGAGYGATGAPMRTLLHALRGRLSSAG